LLAALAAVVGLAKSLTPVVETAVRLLDIPKGLVGIIIAALVLMPECLAALQAARANRLQTSLNLALGSALASIGLTIPAVAAVSIALHQPITLGLNQKEQVLLALTLFIVSSPWVPAEPLCCRASYTWPSSRSCFDRI